MKIITPHRTGVTSFLSTSSPGRDRTPQPQGFEYDSGDYVLSVAAPAPSPPSSHHDALPAASDGCHVVAAALSDRSIVVYDTEAGRVARRIAAAHDGPISQLQFFPREYRGLLLAGDSAPSPPLLLSASQDGTIKVWDVRCDAATADPQRRQPQPQPVLTMRLELPGEQALSASLGYGGTLLAVGTSKARVSFFDLRHSAPGGRPTGALMGSYVDAHTEEVTRVRFQPLAGGGTVLATAAEDGLIAVHDPSKPSEEEALVSVLNVGAPLRDVGFFGPALEGAYALTGSETLSVHHWDSAQRLSDAGGAGLRGLLSAAVAGAGTKEDGAAVEYLVGCTWAPVAAPGAPGAPATAAEPALHLLAGNARGDGFLFRLDADRIAPVLHLAGGHRGPIRDFCWLEEGRRLLTGGEDARLCEWRLGDAPAVGRAARGGGRTPGGGRHRGDKGAAGGNKKFGAPY